MTAIKQGWGVQRIGKAQRRIINMMLENNGTWSLQWRLFAPDKLVMKSLIKRGIVRNCTVRVGVREYPSFALTEDFKNGRVQRPMKECCKVPEQFVICHCLEHWHPHRKTEECRQ